MAANWKTDPITLPQIEYIENLVKDRDTSQLTWIDATMEKVRDAKASGVTKGNARDLIDILKKLPWRKVVAGTPAVAPKVLAPVGEPVTEDGMYRTPDGVIYKVQKNIANGGGGRLYAKQLSQMEFPRNLANGKVRTHEFIYEPGAIRRLTPAMRMTLEEAKAWGSLCAGKV